MGSRKGLVYAVIERFDGMMAIGESRRSAKQEIRERDGPQWTISTGKIHSYGTRTNYQRHVIHFAKWARDQHNVKRLEQLDQGAAPLASEYLQARLAAGQSPYTLKAERAALRLFFGQRTLAQEVSLPRRARTEISRSRGAAARDRHFQPNNWPDHVNFANSFGLRRSEMRDIRVGEIYHRHDGSLVAYVRNGKGGLHREVPCLPGQGIAVQKFIQGRKESEKAFNGVPGFMDVHAYRRQYAQNLYQHISGRELPPTGGRLRASDYDRAAVQLVSRALGHRRIDVVLTHYLR